MVTIEQVIEIGNEYHAIIKKHYHINDIEWKLMAKGRVTKTYGVCITGHGYFGADSTSIIKINPNLKYEKDLREVIAHELTHAIRKCVAHHHDKVWKGIAYDVCHNILGLSGGWERTNHRELDGILSQNIKLQFQMTEYGTQFQRRGEYKNAETIHVKEISPRQMKKYQRLVDKKIITIISKEEI